MVRNIIITITLLTLIGQFTSAQSKKVKSLLESIEGEWKVNTNGEVEYSKVIKCSSQSSKDLFLIGERYFLDAYKTDKVFETNNKEQGLLIGYCIWENIFTGFTPNKILISTVYRTIIECKEEKIRIRVLLTEFDVRGQDFSTYNTTGERKLIKEYFPINKSGSYKTSFGKAFYLSHINAVNILNNVEQAYTKQSNDNW